MKNQFFSHVELFTFCQKYMYSSFETLKILFFDPAMQNENNNIGARIDPNHT